MRLRWILAYRISLASIFKGGKMFKILPLLFIMAFASNAIAEGACPPGQYQIGGQGAVACAPIPQENSVQQQPVAPRPTGEWIKTWGAIAVGSVDSTTIYGITTGKLSKSDAEEDSLKRCSSRAKDNCNVAFTYHNQCVAIAEPQINGLPLTDGLIKFISAATIAEASTEASKRCIELNKKVPNTTCKVVYTACTEPLFYRY
ncbi:DUF4189 domain-containing protein [Pseudomonas syringae]|uniref:DUF4189 domain-containing protein n=1 Tax=Pseudomonas syringae TaxID=317 RepID=UPI0009B12040